MGKILAASLNVKVVRERATLTARLIDRPFVQCSQKARNEVQITNIVMSGSKTVHQKWLQCLVSLG